MRKINGVFPPHKKHTAGLKPEPMPVPAQVCIPMSMHSGAPATPVVKVGDEVRVGQLIGESSGFISAPVHASVSGKVKSINDRDFITGQKAVSITIESDGNQTPFDIPGPPKVETVQDFLDAVRDSGAVGLGGAGFPTCAKLTRKGVDGLDFILVNGAECEPYITSDTRTMIDDAEHVFEGIKHLKKHLNANKVIVCIEDNKPEAIRKMMAVTGGAEGVEVRAMPSIYPQGERKVLVYNVTGRIVPENTRLTDVGCQVINCTTTAVIGRYIKYGIPLINKIVTVDGSSIGSPKNVLAPIGASLRELFEFCGGFTGGDPKRILVGGPMMGIAQPSLDMPVVKVTNAALAFIDKDVIKPEMTACIKCGRCIRKCPMSLMPVNIETAYEMRNPEMMEKYRVGICIECGCCAFSCPAKRPLVQVMQLSKSILKAYNAEQKAAKEAKAAAAPKGGSKGE